MKQLLFLCTLALLIVGCRDDEMDQGEKEYSFQDSSTIQIDSLKKYVVISGNKIVFSFRNSRGENDQIMDNEGGIGVSFEVDSEVNSFYFKDDQFKLAKVHYYYWSAWTPSDYVKVKKGSIKGTKISDDLWEVEIDVEAESLDLVIIKEKGKFKRM